MNYVDLIIAVFAVAFAVIGYERGLVASALPLAGFVLGAIMGGRLGPALLSQGGESPYAPLITVVCGLLVGTAFAVLMEDAVEGAEDRRLLKLVADSPLAGPRGEGGATGARDRP